MGNKGAKGGKPAASNKPAELTKKDYDFLVQQTGLQKPEIKAVFDKFNANNPDGKLDKKEFVRLYDELRPEPPEVLDEISEYVFRAFDSDHNGFISFNEFMVAYAMTSRGDPTKKLNYAFDVYDLDGNGYLDSNELKTVIVGMLDMLGADKKVHSAQALAAEIMKDLDSTHDGKVSKDEFIKGLLANPALRALMNPFA